MQGLGVLPATNSSVGNDVSADGGTIVGYCNFANGATAFRWTQGFGMQSLGVFPGATHTFAEEASAHGSVIAGTANVAGSDRAFRWTEATGMVSPGSLPGLTVSRSNGMSPGGDVIVGTMEVGGTARPFYWTPQSGLQDFAAMLGSAVPPEWDVRGAVGVLADGLTVTGVGILNGEIRSWIATVPTPTTAIIVALALVMAGRSRRRPD